MCYLCAWFSFEDEGMLGIVGYLPPLNHPLRNLINFYQRFNVGVYRLGLLGLCAQVCLQAYCARRTVTGAKVFFELRT